MTVQRTFHAISIFAIAIILASCGGGGGSSRAPAPAPVPTPDPDPDPDPTPSPDDPFGLTVRASLAAFTLPQQSGGGNAFALQNAYPDQGFDRPIYVTGVPGENRIAVVEQRGRIRTFPNERTAVGSRQVLDIVGQVDFGGEEGLLGLAFDPAFTQNRYIYLNYIVRYDRTRVSRFTWDAGTDLVDPATEKVILEVDQPESNHNGGHLAFGPDGYLYIGLGDGGGSGDPLNNSQDVSSLLGKMLRIDVHPNNPSDPYDLPLDNPFINDPNVRSEIWALGLRNPWRFSFDRQSGDLLLGDVGQNQIEEIDHIVAGGNYGWRVFEGTRNYDSTGNSLPNSAFTPPLVEYDHSAGASVTGGYVYRGNNLAALFGRYVYADFSTGTVWAFNWDGSTATNNQIIASAETLSSFGETNEGELLITSFSPISIFQLVDNGGGGEIPTLLSQTGLFTDLAALTPASGLIEYTVRHPFYSDNADKRRWVGLPNGTQVDFADDDLTFPTGTVVVKHFTMNMLEDDATSARRLETRVLINTETGWLGFTYRWNANETDATLLNSRESETLSIELVGGGTREQTYEYPSRTDCLVCHTASAGYTLGLKTPQLNGNFDYDGTVDNQLRSWNNIDLFDQDIGDVSQYGRFVQLGDTAATLATRARTYLDVNCSNCHRPNGPTGTDLDLRFEASNMNAIGVAPSGGDLGVANALIIAAGDHERSILWHRMQRLDSERMPRLGSHVVDEDNLTLIGDWIDSL